jgi:prolyl-tRNA synthetase
MYAIGAQEWLAPVLTPAELWEATGRYGITELFKLDDRAGRHYVLPLTHEETFAFHAREIQSYKELPQLWYHFQTKDRDEPRPRSGLIRVREFIMKDSYSFDRDEVGLEESFRKHGGAYWKIFERCGLEFYEVAAESGIMGGSGSRDFLAPAGSGENTLVTCENGDFAADIEVARQFHVGRRSRSDSSGPRRSRRPGRPRSRRSPSSSRSTRGRRRRRCRS